MSYDLMVFDPDAAPLDREEFIAWYHEEAKWSEGHRYDDPKVCPRNLRAWFLEIIKEFPPLNGPYAARRSHEPKPTDYSIGKSVIYSAFPWSHSRDAYHAVFELAKKHGVGFFDVSGFEGQVWLPDPEGGLVCIHAEREPANPEESTAQEKEGLDALGEQLFRDP